MMAHRSSFAALLNSPRTYLVLCGLCAAVFYTGLFPGKLYADTLVNVYNALDDNFGAIFPAVIGATFQRIFVFDPSLRIIFLFQVLSYWLGVFLLIWAALRMRAGNGIVALLLLLVAIFPYTLNYQFLLLKDTWLLNSYLVFFGLFGLSLTMKGWRIPLLCVMFLVAFNLVLLRNEFLPVILPLVVCLLLTLNARMPLRLKAGWLFMTLLGSVIASGVVFLAATLTSDILSDDRRMGTDYNLSLHAARELVALSVLDDHQGVTAELSETTKDRLDRVYETRWNWWVSAVGVETKDLVNDLKESPTVREQWFEAVRAQPWRYAGHRWHIFAEHFDGSLDFNGFLLNRKVPFDSERYQRITREIDVQEIENNVVWRAYALYIRGFFYVMPTMAWIPVLSLLMLAWSTVSAFRSGLLRRHEAMVIMMNLAAWSYMGPYLLMLWHTEARYVYPALSLALFSVPFFLAKWWGGSVAVKQVPEGFFSGAEPSRV